MRAFFDTVNAEGLVAAIRTMAEDSTWWAQGATHGRSEMIDLIAGFGDVLAEPLRITPGTLTAEGDRVAAEATSAAVLKNGTRYANSYHFLFTLRDGKITSVREHNDTKHSAEVFGTLA